MEQTVKIDRSIVCNQSGKYLLISFRNTTFDPFTYQKVLDKKMLIITALKKNSDHQLSKQGK